MATYLVWAGGNNSSGTEASGWANAYTAFASAVTAATTDGDIIKVHKTHQEELGADTTYTFTADVEVICVDKDNSDAPSTMGTGGWVGNSTTNRSISLVCTAVTIYLYGITLRTSGSTVDSITIGASSTSGGIILEDCYLWSGNSAATTVINLRSVASNSSGVRIKVINTTFRFGNASQQIRIGSNVEIIGGSISADGSAITTIFNDNGVSDPSGAYLFVEGMDLSAASSTATVVGDCTLYPLNAYLSNCKLPSSFTALAAQTDATFGTGEVTLFNCSSGDTHFAFQYENYYGSLTAVSDVYISDGAEYNETGTKYSWKIVTSAGASIYTPFVSPYIFMHNETLTAITPSIEGLRINNATVAQNDEVWAEFMYQGTTGFPLSVRNATDKMAIFGSPANQTSAKTYSDWTASPATDTGDSTFKLTPTANFTPQEIGPLSARVVVGEPSITVYVDPQIRT